MGMRNIQYMISRNARLDVTSLHLPNDKVVSVDNNILALSVYAKIRCEENSPERMKYLMGIAVAQLSDGQLSLLFAS